MENNERPPRPLGVTILLGIVLSLSAWNGLRLAQAIAFWDILKEYQVRNGPAYLAISGAAWLIAGLVLAWGLGRGFAWSRVMAILAAIGYAGWVWFDRLVMQSTRTNWPFALIVTILLFVFTLLDLLDPDVKAYFSQREAYERPS